MARALELSAATALLALSAVLAPGHADADAGAGASPHANPSVPSGGTTRGPVTSRPGDKDDGDCGLEDPAIAAKAPRIEQKAGASRIADAASRSAVRRGKSDAGERGRVASARAGALEGKTIYLSAGHGLTWDVDSQRWETQRGNAHNQVEDFISSESAAYFLIQYLRNMGAYVVPIRESDVNPNLVIVDDSEPGFVVEGALAPMPGPTGFGPQSFPITGTTRPFSTGTSTLLTAEATETGRALWVLEVPEEGEYNVYISFAQDPSRASDAHYIVRHAGGEAHFRVDQRRHGSTWVLLGRYWFDAGRSPERGAIVLANDSAQPGATLSADAVRIGGGTALIQRGGEVTGRPMFEHAGRYGTQLNGAPASVFAYASNDRNSDVGSRPRFAAWDYAEGEDAVYVSWHTNAPEGGEGTVTYAYGNTPNGPVSEFSGVPGSLELMDAIHSELVSDIRAGWDPEWRDRGQRTAYFGEVNPSHNPFMPAVLVEVAFHATLSEANALRDPRFRSLAARAIAQGVAKYFAGRDGVPLVLPPEPPVALVMSPSSEGGLRLRWRAAQEDVPGAGHAPSAYRVYLSRDGRAFDEGRDVTGEVYEIADAPTDRPLYARVTALNAGGESLPSAVVGARVGEGGRAQVLVVNGFERLDRGMVITDDLSRFGLGQIDRGFVERMNSRQYIARHGDAISAAGVSFASATADAVALGDVVLSAYAAVDWFVGEESTCCDPLSEEERAAIAAYLAGGGKLFLSGSELGWALDYRGTAADRAFFRETFRAEYVADDATTRAALGVGGPFVDLRTVDFGDVDIGGYDADYPDRYRPLAGATAVIAYLAGTGGAAGVWYGDDASGERLFLLGFPFETIRGRMVRAVFMAAILTGFGIEPDPVRPDSEEPESGDAGLPGSGAGDGPDAGTGSSPDAGPMGAGLDEAEVVASCSCEVGRGPSRLPYGGGWGAALLFLGVLILRGRRPRP